MLNIKKTLDNLPISKKFLVSFGFIFGLIFIFMGYSFYVLRVINKNVGDEIYIQKIAMLTTDLRLIVLRNSVLLNQYTDVYDESLINEFKKNRVLAAEYTLNLRKLAPNAQLINNLNAYELLVSHRHALADKIIRAVNQHASAQEIISLRQERMALDNESRSYLRRMTEMTSNELDEAIKNGAELRSNLQISIIVASLLILSILALVSYWIILSTTLPIRIISSVVEKVAQGNLDAKAKIETDDEFGKLARSFNVMTMKLKIAMEGRMKAEAKLEHIAHYDYLTDIPNRLLFDYTLSRTLAIAKRNKKCFVVMLLDLDRFKNVNDTLGHEAGDLLLQQVCKRFQSTMRTEDMLARLGGDEFGIILNDIHQIEDAGMTAKKIIDCLQEPFLLSGEKVTMTSSIGVAVYPTAGETASDLLKNVDKAMYQAKSMGKNNFQFYAPESRLT